MKVNIENVFESKEKFPDEVISGIAEATSKVADMIPSSVFAGCTDEQIMAFWQNAQNFMVLGAGIAMEYMKNKKSDSGKSVLMNRLNDVIRKKCKTENDSNLNWVKWVERKPAEGEFILVISTAFCGYEIAHFGKAAIGVVEKLRELDIDYLYWTYLPKK